MTHCQICGRKLTNPVSVELRIGPVCRGGRIDYGQREFDFGGENMHASFELITHVYGEYIFIRDIGHRQFKTVTNDVQYVILELYDRYSITDETRIIYEDSEGQRDEILHEGKKFVDFKFGHEGVEL